MKKKHKTKEQKQSNKLDWVLREWDCRSLEQAKKIAKEDKELHYVLRECGVKF